MGFILALLVFFLLAYLASNAGKQIARRRKGGPTTPSASKWSVSVAQSTYGPFQFEEMTRFMSEGRLLPDTLVSRNNSSTWIRADEDPNIKVLFFKSPILQAGQPTSPVIGVVAVGLGAASIFLPYFAAVFFGPVGLICGIIAYRNTQRNLGIVAIVLSMIGLIGVLVVSNEISSLMSGESSSVKAVNDSVANDAINEYQIAKRQGDRMQVCVQAGMVAAALLLAKNEADYRTWKNIEHVDCAEAGIQRP